ncbi:AEC family transporter [Schumannella luteola]
MIGVLVGFAVIATIILIGYIVGRLGVLGDHAQLVLGRFAFYVASPCLLFTVLADADIHVLFSSLLVVSLVAAVGSGLVFFVIARLVWKREISESVIGSLGSGYVNANNMGIPVAVFVLGDAAFAAPVVLLQLLVFAPVALTVLDVQQHGGGSIGRILLRPFRNPIIVGSALGVLVSALQWTPPEELMQPFRIIGAAAVPVMLVSFGMSLHGQRPLAPGTSRRDVLLASSLKLALMPTIAWAFGYFVVGLTGLQLFAVVVLAALPAAQNVFNYAQRYGRGVILARDIVLITTVLSLPALVVVAALLAPH